MTTVRLLLLTVFASSIVGCGFSEKKVQATNESEGKDILFADPTIIQNQGKYYLTGTGNNVSEGFTVMESVDLKKWYLSDNPYILIYFKIHRIKRDRYSRFLCYQRVII